MMMKIITPLQPRTLCNLTKKFIIMLPSSSHGSNSNPLDLSSLANGINELNSKVASLEAKILTKLQESERKFESKIHAIEQKVRNLEMEMTTRKGQKQIFGKQQDLKLDDYKLDDFKVDDTITAISVLDPEASGWKQIWLDCKKFDYSFGDRRTIGSHSPLNMFVEKAFSISAGKLVSGKIINYYEIANLPLNIKGYHSFRVGFSHGPIPSADGSLADCCSNWELMKKNHRADDKEQLFELWSGDISPSLECFHLKDDSIVIGCGIFLNSNNEFVLFFTANGILLKQIPFKKHQPADDFLLYPTTTYLHDPVPTNFGGTDSSRPFKYDINKCPGLDFN